MIGRREPDTAGWSRRWTYRATRRMVLAGSIAACLVAAFTSPAAASMRPGPDSIGEVLGWDQWSGWSVEPPNHKGFTCRGAGSAIRSCPR